MSGAVVRVAASKMRRHGIESRGRSSRRRRRSSRRGCHSSPRRPRGACRSKRRARRRSRRPHRRQSATSKRRRRTGRGGRVVGLVLQLRLLRGAMARWQLHFVWPLAEVLRRYGRARGTMLGWRTGLASLCSECCARCAMQARRIDRGLFQSLAGRRALQPVASRRGMAWCPRRTGGRWRAV